MRDRGPQSSPRPAPDEDWIAGRDRAFAKGGKVKGKVIVTARTIGGGVAVVTTAAQVVSAVVEPVSETVTQVQSITDSAGQVVATTKEIVQVVPETWTAHLLQIAQSPGFLLGVIAVMALTWGVTWYLRRREG